MPTFKLFGALDFGDAFYMKWLVFVVNVFISPFLLVGWSFAIFVYPCMASMLTNVCCRLASYTGMFGACMTFTDNEFQCNDTNCGKTGITWRRMQDVTFASATPGGEKVKVSRLFDGISPGDIAQGQLGDCWLLAGLATLAERPELIQNAFVTKQFNPRGKYTVRLYNDKTQHFENIVIDDFIPCDSSGAPIYTHVKGNEMWPLLVEKAFAKKRGGYHKLEGGLPLDAMQTITGFSGTRIMINSGSSKDLFYRLRKHFDNGCIMACGSRGQDNTREMGRGSVKGSIVGGHAYSILGMYEPSLTTEKVQLLKLRNPWGSFEWKGEWSDKSAEWTDYPGVALELGKPKEADDGIFYIPWKDFCYLYNLVDILFPETAISDLHITGNPKSNPNPYPNPNFKLTLTLTDENL